MVQPFIVSCLDPWQIIKGEQDMQSLSFSSLLGVLQVQQPRSMILGKGFSWDMGAALKAGMCFINNYNVSPVELPFGGYKSSGELCVTSPGTCQLQGL